MDALRPWWLYSVVREFQILADPRQLAVVSRGEARGYLSARIASPTSLIERYLLEGLLTIAASHRTAAADRLLVSSVE
jgi:hypothetical protein